MKVLWCWRCQTDVPMLDESEWPPVHAAHERAVRQLKEYREAKNVSLEAVPESVTRTAFGPMLDAYERATGRRETNPDAILHHRVSLYGCPCDECGRPLRTPEATMCAACGWRLAAEAGIPRSAELQLRARPSSKVMELWELRDAVQSAQHQEQRSLVRTMAVQAPLLLVVLAIAASGAAPLVPTLMVGIAAECLLFVRWWRKQVHLSRRTRLLAEAEARDD